MNTVHLCLTPRQAQSLHSALGSIRTDRLCLTDRIDVDLFLDALHEHREVPADRHRIKTRETVTTTTTVTTRTRQ